MSQCLNSEWREIEDVKQELSWLGDNGLDNPFIPKEAITPAVRRV